MHRQCTSILSFTMHYYCCYGSRDYVAVLIERSMCLDDNRYFGWYHQHEHVPYPRFGVTLRPSNIALYSIYHIRTKSTIRIYMHQWRQTYHESWITISTSIPFRSSENYTISITITIKERFEQGFARS